MLVEVNVSVHRATFRHGSTLSFLIHQVGDHRPFWPFFRNFEEREVVARRIEEKMRTDPVVLATEVHHGFVGVEVPSTVSEADRNRLTCTMIGLLREEYPQATVASVKHW